MIMKKDDLRKLTVKNDAGDVRMYQTHLRDFDGFSPKIRTYMQVDLQPGMEVAYHVHEGEFESYYILSGTGEYNDNGNVITVTPGTTTFTPSGEGHGIKNTSDEVLSFMALIVLD